MNSSGILSVVTFVYGFAAFLYVASWIFKKPEPGRLGTWVVFAGLTGNITGIALRWVESYKLGYGHAPLSNLYESLIFFAGTLAAVYLVIEKNIATGLSAHLPCPFLFWRWPTLRFLPTSATGFSPFCRH
jgi:ABC-type transport system involved in cytochrome c biogenesis permease subunit